MNKNISALLRDLYEIDPALKAHEKELVPLIELLLANNPAREPDENFVQELRMKLQRKADELMQPRPSLFTFFSPLFAGVVATLIVAVPTTYYLARQTIAPVPVGTLENQKTTTDLFSYSINPTQPKAFGDIGRFSAPVGMGGGAPSTANDSVATKLDAPISPRMMALNPARFKYSFSGSMPDLSSKTVQVLAREISFASTAFDSIRSALPIRAIDLASFAGSKVDSLNFVQDTQFGYNVNVNLREGSIAIMQNWDKWPHPEAQCADEACVKKYALTRDQVPSDDALIAAANAFIADHTIDLSHYGKPEVDMSWKNVQPEYDPYVPEIINVLYPLLIEGKPVYDTVGNKMGVGLGVSVRLKKVTDMFGLSNQSYVRSDYDSVTDPAVVESYLKKLDYYPQYEAQKKVVAIELGEPTIAYSMYYSSEAGKKNEELIVPSLVFPVTNAPTDQSFYRRQVIVPLAKDLLEKLGQQGQPMPIDLVRPMDGVGRG